MIQGRCERTEGGAAVVLPLAAVEMKQAARRLQGTQAHRHTPGRSLQGPEVGQGLRKEEVNKFQAVFAHISQQPKDEELLLFPPYLL